MYKVVLNSIKYIDAIAKKYLFLRYDTTLEGSKSITGFYCTCPCGARNVGACAHITSSLWFLGYGRYLENFRRPAEHIFRGVLDARDTNSWDGSYELESPSVSIRQRHSHTLMVK